MTAVILLALLLIAGRLFVTWVRRHGDLDTDWLLDVADVTQPAEPWPPWLLSPRERQGRYDPIAREDER